MKWDLNPIYLEQDRLITSAGTAASMDCCLSIVRKLYGVKIANHIARILVIPPHREGGQAQFIDALFLVPHLIIISMHCLLI